MNCLETTKPVLLDIILEGRYYRQLRYTKRGFPIYIDGKVVEAHNIDDLEAFVREKLPSLVGRDYKIEISKQRV